MLEDPVTDASVSEELLRLRKLAVEQGVHVMALRERLRQRDEEYRQVISSWSWRITRPLRAAQRLGAALGRGGSRWRRLLAVCREEGFRIAAIKARVKLTMGLHELCGRQSPYRIRYRPPRPANGTEDPFVLFLISPRPELNPFVRGGQILYGCAASPAGIARVEIEVDGQPLGTAEHGLPNEGVDPDGESGASCDLREAGFCFAWDTSSYGAGRHRIVVRAVAADGQQREAIATVYLVGADRGQADYQAWIERFEQPAIDAARQDVAQLRDGPLLSVVMPVFNTAPPLLRAAIESVRRQIYPRWELCIGDDGSTDAGTAAALREAEGDSRIKIRRLAENRGISAATNAALQTAAGEFTVLMDADDLLAPHALYEVAATIAASPQTDLIYSDEDKIDAAGKRYDPFFKPDWSPELLLSCNYFNHLTAIRTALLSEIGGFCPTYDFSQDYDLYLRATERTTKIAHIAKILYHWRAAPGSSAAKVGVKTPAQDAARRAIGAAMQRRQEDAEVVPGPGIGTWRVRYRLRGTPLVSVILPTGGRLGLLEKCLDGLRRKTAYRPLEIVLADNSRETAVRTFFDTTVSGSFAAARYLDCRGMPFNYSLLNNWAVQAASGELLLLLNDDIVPINADWMEAMIEHAQRPEVGAVGAKLLYPNGTIQHAGVVMGIFESTGHAFKLAGGDESLHWGYFGLPHLVRNSSAVTAACLMLRRDVFQEVGGFDEEHLPVAFQDVDLCLKILARGYRNVYTPFAKLYHYESVTKSEKVPNRVETAYLAGKWAEIIARDPFYNPNLTRRTEDWSIRTA